VRGWCQRGAKGQAAACFYEGKFTVPDDFDAPLPDEILMSLKAKRSIAGEGMNFLLNANVLLWSVSPNE